MLAARPPANVSVVAPHWSKAHALLTAMDVMACDDVLLYIDSDAVVREHDVTPAEFLRREQVCGLCRSQPSLCRSSC